MFTVVIDGLSLKNSLRHLSVLLSNNLFCPGLINFAGEPAIIPDDWFVKSLLTILLDATTE